MKYFTTVKLILNEIKETISFLFISRTITSKYSPTLWTYQLLHKQVLFFFTSVGFYVREDWIEDIIVEKLKEIFELYLILEGNYFAMDSKLAEEFNRCKTNDKIRFAVDRRIIEERQNYTTNYDFLESLWKCADFETKEKFITEYIDTIEVKTRKHRSNDRPDVNLVNLKFKAHKTTKFFELKKHNEIDEITDKNGIRCSKTIFNNESEASKYIDILSKRFHIKVFDITKNKDYVVNNDLLFKVIDIKPTSLAIPPRTIYLELYDKDEKIVFEGRRKLLS